MTISPEQTLISTITLPVYPTSACTAYASGVVVPVDRAFLAFQITQSNQAMLHFEHTYPMWDQEQENVDFMLVPANIPFQKQARSWLASAFSPMNQILYHLYEGGPF